MRIIAVLALACAVALGLAGCARLGATRAGAPTERANAVPSQAGPSQAGPSRGGVPAAGPSTAGLSGGGSSVPASPLVANTGAPDGGKTHTIKVGGLTRGYVMYTPATGLAAATPVIVMLSGINITLPSEISRDELVPYAAAGLAEVVYPVPVGKSWNAIGCCGQAAARNIDDLAFIKALVAAVDPGHRRPAYVVGYSNGTRLAYRIACTDPGLFDAYAMVKGAPQPDCHVATPLKILQIASVNDPEMPYQPGMKGTRTSTAATTLVGQLRSLDGCRPAGAVTRTGDLTLTRWPCDAGGVAFAVWQTGVHSYPRPPTSNPGAAPVIWSFFTGTALAPSPA